MSIEFSEYDLCCLAVTVVLGALLHVIFRAFCHYEGLRSFRQHTSQLAAQHAVFGEPLANMGPFPERTGRTRTII